MDVTIYPIDLTGTYYVKPLPIVTSDWGADAVAVPASGATITDPADAYWMFEQTGDDPASTDDQVAVLSTLVAKIKERTDNLPDEPASKGDVEDADVSDGVQTLLERTASKVVFNAPINAEGTIITTIKGDDYTVASFNGALEWSAPVADYGDLTGATFSFSSRLAEDGTAEIDNFTEGFTLLNANTSTQRVRLELPASQTSLLTPGVNGETLTNSFQVKVILNDENNTTFTLAHGEPPVSGHTIIPEQV